MELEKYLSDTCIILTPFAVKKRLLASLTKQKQIGKCKIVSLTSLLEAEQLSLEISLYDRIKKGILPSTAFLELSFLSYLEEKEYKSAKLKQLLQLKKELLACHFIEKKPKKSYKNEKIILYGYPTLSKRETLFLEAFKKENTVIKLEEKIKTEKTCYLIFSTVEEELAYVSEQITFLLRDGICPSSIQLFVPDADYFSLLHRFFTIFNIPYDFRQKKSLLAYDMSRYFLEIIKESTVMEALEILTETFDLSHPFLDKLYTKIEKIAEPLEEKDDKETLIKTIKFLFQKETIEKEKWQGCVEVIDSLEEAREEDYLFIVGMHAGSLPVFHKDDDYLSDQEKEELLLETSKETNQKEETDLCFYLSQLPHVKITSAKRSLQKEYAKSTLIERLEKDHTLKKEKGLYQYTNDAYNQYLLAHQLDLYTKYNEKSGELAFLNTYVKTPYMQYQNAYQKIETENLYTYLKNHLVLSYSSLENFYKCPFRFYMENILKIRSLKKDSMSQIFGNIVHEVLSQLLKEEPADKNGVIEEIVQAYFLGKEVTEREKFYQEKYKKEIAKLVDLIEEQRKQTEFKETGFEEEIVLKQEQKILVSLKGYIDKIMTFKDEKGIQAVIVDYKTGTITPSFHTVIHGLGMQLLLYYYLLKQTRSDYQFAGVYWQNVLKDVLPSEKGKSYEQILKEAYKWMGYTKDDASLVFHLDTHLEDSFIKSLKLKKDGTFYSYSKVINDKELEQLLHIVEEKIKEAEEKILAADFPIEPKRIGNEKIDAITGCAYCMYRSICYRRNKDILSLKEYKGLEYLEGDASA